MRRRSETIYAANEEEFKEIMKKQEEAKRPVKRSKFSKMTEHQLSVEDNLYSSSKAYQLQEKQLSLEEQEKLEEEQLLNSFQNLNIFYKEKEKEDFMNSISDLSTYHSDLNVFYSQLQKLKNPPGSKGHDNNQKANKNSNRSFSFNYKDMLAKDETNCEHASKVNFPTIFEANTNCLMNNHEIIKQNLEVYEDILKIMVIGGSHVGKSLFVSKLLGLVKKSYLPTQNLEIHNKIVKLFGKIVKLEVYDTSHNILNDPLINIYYKICNGFVLICNSEDINSVKFLEKQLEYLINLPNTNSDNIIILNNEKKQNPQSVGNLYLASIMKRYNIKINTLNLNYMDDNKILFDKFFSKILVTKFNRIKKQSSKMSVSKFLSNNSISIKYNSNNEKNSEKRNRKNLCHSELKKKI
jgi:GTPase SAR1 family protein